MIQFDSQYQGNECHKLNLDQYYTPYFLAEACTRKTIDILGIENISEFYEPSAGTGVFVKAVKEVVPNTEIYAADLEPKADNIVQEDFLEKELRYKKNRCFIGNPLSGQGLRLHKSSGRNVFMQATMLLGFCLFHNLTIMQVCMSLI